MGSISFTIVSEVKGCFYGKRDWLHFGHQTRRLLQILTVCGCSCQGVCDMDNPNDSFCAAGPDGATCLIAGRLSFFEKRFEVIIWLASYPRSGNTLFRTILRRCFGLYSHADEPVDHQSEFRSNPDLIGHRDPPADWESFYRHASASPEIYPVKTHRPPPDDQPFIYIVRDGRSAVLSFQKFNREYNGRDFSLAGLILGAGGYGGWSAHYRGWNDREGVRRLVLRYEDLVDVSPDTLKDVAAFIGFSNSPQAWENPLEILKKKEPAFFGGQRIKFSGDERWSPSHEFLFAGIHGEVMTRLGYYDAGRKRDFSKDLPGHAIAVMTEMMAFFNDLDAENRNLRKTCEERLAVIQELDAACEERLRLINALHDHMNKREGK